MNERSDETADEGSIRQSRFDRQSRRRFLATSSVAAITAIAGCGQLGTSTPENESGDSGTPAQNEISLETFRGSGPLVEKRSKPGGTSMEELSALSGTLSLYLGGGEGGLYLDLLRRLEKIYPDFEVEQTIEPSSELANKIIEESKANATQADVFIAVDAGSLGVVADAGATQKLPDSVRNPVPNSFQSDAGNWVGLAGRARSVPYNTDKFSSSDIPGTVQEFPETASFTDVVGWAPTYGAFQSFVTAMRLLRGENATKQWLNRMQELNVTAFPDEFRVSNAVADGELGVGFANHYYALRVQATRPDAPIDLAFTKNDAGALVNVSGAAILSGSNQIDLASNFIRHLLSSEAQEFFATQTYAYPMIPEVPPVGGLPRIDELNPPDIDLTALSALQQTLTILRETGVL